MYLNLYKDKDCEQEYCKIGDTQENLDINTIESKDFLNALDTHICAQGEIICAVAYHKNKVENIVIHKHNKEVFVDISKPFAPGTYIELEAKGENLPQEIYWKIDIRAIKQHHIQTFNQSIETKNNKNNLYKAYLSTPQAISSYKEQGFSKFEAIIYASSVNCFYASMPHIVFNLNFEVGDGLDGSVIESNANTPYTGFKIHTFLISSSRISTNDIQ